MKLRHLTYFFCAVFMITELSLSAQANWRKPPNPPVRGVPPIYPETPIDGGLTYLIIAGVAYGVYQKKRKKPSN
jgi:hypothetical protein